MKTLPTNVSDNYLKVGSRPRIFVNIANVGGNSVGSWGTTTGVTGYTDRIARGNSFSEKADVFGGMTFVSGADVQVLKLGEEIKWYISTSINPRGQGAEIGAGRILKTGGAGEGYAAFVRAATTGTNQNSNNIVIGQLFNVGTTQYSIYRGYFQFDIPAALESCEDAYINLTGADDNSDTDFSFNLVEGLWTTTPSGSGVILGTFNDFSGWNASGTTDYTGDILNEAFTTAAHFSTLNTNRLRLNKVGRDLLVTKAGSTLKLMLLSSRDYDYESSNTPTGDEFVRMQVSGGSTPTLEIIYNTTKPENQRTRIYLGYDDQSSGLPVAVSSFLNVWSGVVDRWDLNEKILDLSLRHDDFKRNISLAADVINIEDSGFSNTPAENIGKPKPIVFGDFTTTTNHQEGIGSFLEETNSNRYSYGDFIFGYVYDALTSESSKKIIFANHALMEYGAFMAMWEPSVGTYTAIAGEVSSAAEGDGTRTISKGATATDFPYRATQDTETSSALYPVITRIPLQVFNFGVTDPNNAIDEDDSNWSTIDLAGETCEYQTNLPYGVTGLLQQVVVVIETSAALGYTTDKLELAITYHRENGTSDPDTSFINADGQTVIYKTWIQNDTSVMSDNLVRVIVSVTAKSGFDSAKPVLYRNICVVRAYTTDFPLNVFMPGKGLEDTTGAYTGTASTLIENPSDIIRWFGIVKGSLTASEIDSSFDDARTTLTGWKFAFQWMGKAGFKEIFNFDGDSGIISKMAEQCKSIARWDNEGNLTIRPLDISVGFPNSGTDVPDDLDRFELSGSPSSNSLTRHPIMPGSFQMNKWNADNTYNDFVLHYRKNYATGDYNNVLFMTNGAGTAGSVSTNIDDTEFSLASSSTLDELKGFASASFNENLTTNTFDFEAWAIRDEQTAVFLLQSFIEWYTRRRWFVDLTTGLNALAFEIGDYINVRTDDIEDQFGAGTMETKKWRILEIDTDLSNMKIHIKAIEAEIY